MRANLMAGLTVGIVALPLSMALAIASGVPPQHGLYTAIVAGIVIALTGSSRLNISGPTAAFVVILLPIVHQFGLGGLLLSGFIAGVILVVMGLLRLGTLIELVPYPVTVGFTSGIAVVIATTQLKDFFGLSIESEGHSFVDKAVGIVSALPEFQWQELAIALLTLLTLLLWNRTGSRTPAHLAALTLGTVAAWLGSRMLDGVSVHTVASTFEYTMNGITAGGIPPIAPRFFWPWQQPGPDGAPIGLSWELFGQLAGPAIAIALLGAIESLLCAVVSDSMAGTRTDPNRELIGHGIGNMVVPFFGGIPATAAIARTATNFRSGATNPLASVIHALVILAAILLLAPLLGHIPMAAMAALLMVVAWNMSEARHFIHILKVAPRHDILVLLTCFSLTVLIDMEVAVAAGMALASVLFIKRMIELTGVNLINPGHEHADADVPEEIVIYDINGPMFFGAAQNALKTLVSIRSEVKVVVLDLSDVPMIDMTAMVAMQSIVNNLAARGVSLIFCGLTAEVRLKLKQSGMLSGASVSLKRNRGDSIDAAKVMLSGEKKEG
ncbi:sulfate permease, SulP family [Mariprofundus micogutta]|uniref:Sulfate permease, SulP family n=2 Tax=Mariprofundus micogutta TaxID=1921010 RepID=A0A1L8CMT3_9PROT|nr:sulfate permease, SulP family [Mariprofundus micogutta]